MSARSVTSVGAAGEQFGGVPGACDADDEHESAVAAGCHARLGVFDDDTPIRPHTQPVRRLDEHGGIGLAGEPELVGDDTVHTGAEHVVKAGGLQDLFAVSARRVHRGADTQVVELTHQRSCGRESGDAAGQNWRKSRCLRLPRPQIVSSLSSEIRPSGARFPARQGNRGLRRSATCRRRSADSRHR